MTPESSIARRSIDLPEFEAAVVIGSGPSLTAEDCEAAREWRRASPARLVVVVNTTFDACPWADVCYAGDKWWFDAYYHKAQRRFLGAVWTGSAAAKLAYPGAQLVRRVPGPRLPQGDSICVGGAAGNSGLQAIYLAALRTRRIGLLGFDGGPSEDGRAHHHEDHPAPSSNARDSAGWPGTFAAGAAQLADRGVDVANLSRSTRLSCFRREEAASWLTS